MDVSVGTFNLNNLFSRFNFRGQVTSLPDQPPIEFTSTFELPETVPELAAEDLDPLERAPALREYRTYKGKLVHGKDIEDTRRVARRILDMDVDVLGLQEVEDVATLRNFVREYLDNAYRHVALIEGNDPRLIDVALVSKLPLGRVVSWQQTRHESEPTGLPIFSRDVLEVDVLAPGRTKRLLTVYVNHLKSKFTEHRAGHPLHEQELADAATRRGMQAETLMQIVERQQRPDGRYVVLGDMNDSAESEPLSFFDPLVDWLTTVEERGGTPSYGDFPPATARWTSRFKPSGEPPVYELFDQVWLSPALAERQTGAFVLRRTKLTRDGTDHDPTWVTLDL
jgi:predicted extracellular nuclease